MSLPSRRPPSGCVSKIPRNDQEEDTRLISPSPYRFSLISFPHCLPLTSPSPPEPPAPPGTPAMSARRPAAPTPASRRRYPSYGSWWWWRWWWWAAAVVVVVAAVLAPAVLAEWDTNCPSSCRCTYVSNRKVVKCERAGYSTVPRNLSPEVQELVLTGNQIKQLDSHEFQQAGLVNLQLLDLSENAISYVDKDAFSGLKILIELDLKHNQIERLHQFTFSGMEKLRKLVLSRNLLTRLEARQFPELLHLRTLKLDNNDISYIHNFAFMNLPNLTALELSSNALHGVEAALFTPTAKLVSLELANNRWSCDCNLRAFARWLAVSDTLRNTDWNCYSPDRLKDMDWTEVALDDFACDPVIKTPQEVVSLVVGSHGALRCWAKGDPMPTFKWVADRKILSNMSTIGDSSDHYSVITVTNDTGVYSTLDLGTFGDAHPMAYACIAENSAKSVEKTIEVVVGSGDTLDVIVNSGSQLWIFLIVAGVLIVVVVLLIVLVLCLWCRRRKSGTKTPKGKLNGSAGSGDNVMVVPHSSQVNPVVKPMRQYEKLPQKDIEMTSVGSSQGEGGAHKSFEELNYPANQSIYMDRSRLPPVEEESPMVGLYSPLTYHHVPPAPSPTLTIQSNMTQQTTASHYPDILDNVRIPRTISPTQMSYQSLAYPPPLGPEWRFSYALPGDYSGSYASEYSHSPVAYSTPQHQRPGYVTLPRRPRAPSWNGVPSPNLHVPVLSPTIPPRDTIYDTLGPRTTADGTSTTDLTRPGSRTALYEPLPPGAGSITPTSPLALAAHYTSAAANRPRHGYPHKVGASQTLPRSTPNLLDDPVRPLPSKRRPADVYSPADVHASEIEPLIEDPHLGIPYDPKQQQQLRLSFAPSSGPEVDPFTALNASLSIMNQSLINNNNNNNNNNSTSKNNLNNNNNNNNNAGSPPRKDPHKTPLMTSSPSALTSPDLSPSKSSTRNTSSVSPSPVPTPTQILSAASAPLARPSPSSTPNRDASRAASPLSGEAIASPVRPNGYSGSLTDGTALPSFLQSPTPKTAGGGDAGLPKKKVPPKPPPKPSKRLSVASTASDVSGVRQTSVLYEDNGPDGSEV